METGNLMDNHDDSHKVEVLSNQPGDSTRKTGKEKKKKNKKNRPRYRQDEDETGNTRSAP